MSLLDTTASEHTGVTVEEADEATVRENLDRLAQRFLDLSGDAFMALRGSGQLGSLVDQPGFGRVNAVASLLDDARENAS